MNLGIFKIGVVNMKKEKLVILLSTYNGDKYLKEQINSILNQSYKNWILLIRDDGSTDSTKNIISLYTQKDVRIKEIKDNLGNIGPLRSFKTLISYTDGFEYVMFADQDDIWYKWKIRNSLTIIEQMNDKYRLVYTNYNVSGGASEHVAYKENMGLKSKPNNILVQSWLMGCTMIISDELMYLGKNIPDSAKNHDNWYAKLASVVGKIEYVHQPTMMHRLHENNVTRNISTSKRMTRILNLFSNIRNRDQIFKDYYDNSRDLVNVTENIQTNGRGICTLNEYYKLFRLGKLQRLKALFKNRFKAFSLNQNIIFLLILFFGKKINSHE